MLLNFSNLWSIQKLLRHCLKKQNKRRNIEIYVLLLTLRLRLCRFQFFRNLGGGLRCGKVLNRLPMCLALNELLHFCKAATRFFHKSVGIKEVNNCTYVMTFASSMKSSSDMAPSFIILTATGVCCHQPCLTVCCMKNEYLSIISYSIFTALTKLPY